MADAFWFDPSTVHFKIAPHGDLGKVEGGDWDIERRHAVATNIKHQAVVQRYVGGARWEDTELFREIYARRFAGGGRVRGEKTIDGLAAQYYRRVDGIFEDLQRRGFCLADSGGAPYPLPNLLIGRDGGIFLGNNGNHRFAMAMILKLPRIAGEVICRHKSSLAGGSKE
jgi:hypothetical protein